DVHVALDRVAETELRLPADVLVIGVDPEEQLLLGPLGLLAVGRLVAGVGLEVFGHVVCELRQQRRAEQEAHVERAGDADFVACDTGLLEGLFDDPQVGTLGAAEVRVPLILLEVSEDRVLRVGHLGESPLGDTARFASRSYRVSARSVKPGPGPRPPVRLAENVQSRRESRRTRGNGRGIEMKRALAFAGFTAAFCLALAPIAGAATQTQTRTCPLPVVGGDPDTVTLAGPVGTTWTVTADESPGEPSHIVSITVQVSASDGSGPALRVQTGL